MLQRVFLCILSFTLHIVSAASSTIGINSPQDGGVMMIADIRR